MTADTDAPLPDDSAPQRNLMAAREDFIGQLVKSAQAQIDDITRRVTAGTRDGAQAERDARATAALVKVLCAMGRDGKQGDKPEEDAADDDEGPRDLDEFRRELGRQMDEIVARRTDRAAGATDDTER
jgi:hypothetical protein